MTPEEYAEVDELRRAHDLMAAQFQVMQREKEHGWREAEKWEGRADTLAAEVSALRTAAADAWDEGFEVALRPQGPRSGVGYTLVSIPNPYRAALDGATDA